MVPPILSPLRRHSRYDVGRSPHGFTLIRKVFMSRHARSARLLLLSAALLGTFASPAVAQPDRVVLVSWNVESGDANPANLAARIRQFQGVDIWALSEVEGDAWLNLFEPAAED